MGVLKTRFATMDEVGRKRNRGLVDAMGTSETPPGKRYRAVADAMDISGGSPAGRESRCRATDPHLASVADEEIVKGRAQSEGPWTQARWGANQGPPAKGVGCAISLWVAEGCSRVSGQE